MLSKQRIDEIKDTMTDDKYLGDKHPIRMANKAIRELLEDREALVGRPVAPKLHRKLSDREHQACHDFIEQHSKACFTTANPDGVIMAAVYVNPIYKFAEWQRYTLICTLEAMRAFAERTALKE